MKVFEDGIARNDQCFDLSEREFDDGIHTSASFFANGGAFASDPSYANVETFTSTPSYSDDGTLLSARSYANGTTLPPLAIAEGFEISADAYDADDFQLSPNGPSPTDETPSDVSSDFQLSGETDGNSAKKVKKSVVKVTCHVCNKEVVKRKLREHMVYHSGDRQFKCTICPLSFFRKYHLDRHMNTHGPNETAAAKTKNEEVCNKVENDSEGNDKMVAKIEHSEMSSGALEVDALMEPYKSERPAAKSNKADCPVCKKTVMRRKLKEHMRLHAPHTFHCHLCVKTFPRKYNLDRHLAAHERMSKVGAIKEKTADDGITDKIKKSEEAIEKTEIEDAVENPEPQPTDQLARPKILPRACRGCPKSFKTNGQLKIHIFRKHKSLFRTSYPDDPWLQSLEKVSAKASKSPIMYQCTFCGKTCKGKYKLNEHMIVHQKATPYPCDKCDMAFKSDARLKRHKLCHDDNRPMFHCDLCDAVLSSKKSLLTHQIVHKKDTPFACHACPATFKHKAYLRIHLRVHSDEMPYQCVICGKSFKDPSTLRDHGAVHTTERPFICPYCGKG